MKRIIYEPLHKEYTELIITTTALEAHFSPFKYKTTKEKSESHYEFGDAVHEAVTAILYNHELQEEVMAYYAMHLSKEQLGRLHKILQQCSRLPEIVIAGAKNKIAIEFGKYLVIYIGKFDILFKKKVNDETIYGVAEIKTAAHALSREELEDRIQLLSYKWLSGVEKVEWWVFAKDGNPVLQIHDNLNIPDNAEDTMIAKIKTYLEQKYWYTYEDPT